LTSGARTGVDIVRIVTMSPAGRHVRCTSTGLCWQSGYEVEREVESHLRAGARAITIDLEHVLFADAHGLAHLRRAIELALARGAAVRVSSSHAIRSLLEAAGIDLA
jgi:anti-anti-sigma regulatory factor